MEDGSLGTRYWLATFTKESWPTFLTIDPPTVGLKHLPPGIAVGDVFLNYVRSHGRTPGEWVSAERIQSESLYDSSHIYDDGVWPHRWLVESLTARHTFGEGVVGRNLVCELQLTRNLGRHWGSALRSPGREIPAVDGQLLVRRLGEL